MRSCVRRADAGDFAVAIRSRTTSRARTVRLLALLLILLLPAPPAKAILDIVVGGFAAALVARSTIADAKEAAHEVIDDLDRRVKARIDQAVDESTRKAGQEVSLRLREARAHLDEIIEKTFEKAKEERKAFFQQLAEERRAVFEGVDLLMARFEGSNNSLLNRFDSIANRLLIDASKEVDIALLVLRDAKLIEAPTNMKEAFLGKKEKGRETYGIYRFYGGGVAYKPSGTYGFGASGKGLGREAGPTADSMTILVDGRHPTGLRQHVDREYARTFEVPVDALNGSFADVVPRGATLSFRNNLVQTQQDITLFPKFPVRYRLTAELADGTEAALHITGPGKEFLDAEEALVRRLVAAAREGNPVDAVPPPDEDQAVRDRLGEIVALMRERLPLGDDYRVDLPQVSRSWRLRIDWTDGVGTTLQPGNSSGLGVQVIEDSQAPGRRRLNIRVGLP